MTLEQLKLNLALTLQYMQASGPLLLEAYCQVSAGTPMAAYFFKHYEEERQHAEWLAEDLEGFSVPPHPLTACMAGSMYYLIRHVDPACLLGYMLALERPIPMQAVEQLEAAFGKPLLRTVRIHAEEDPKHAADLTALIADLPGTTKANVAMAHAWTQDYMKQLDVIVRGAQ